MDEENIEEEQNDEDDDDEDDDSLKLSWQMLDWARKLFEAATDQEVSYLFPGSMIIDLSIHVNTNRLSLSSIEYISNPRQWMVVFRINGNLKSANFLTTNKE